LLPGHKASGLGLVFEQVGQATEKYNPLEASCSNTAPSEPLSSNHVSGASCEHLEAIEVAGLLAGIDVDQDGFDRTIP
jgi:hypothetical protein